MSLFRNVLKGKLLLVTVTSLLFVTPAINANAASYELLSNSSNLSLGDSFEVSVSAKDIFAGDYVQDELLGFGFNFGFNSTVLELSSVSADSSQWIDLTGSFSDAMVAGMAFPSITNQGQDSVMLAKLTFKVIGNGSSQISISSHYDAAHLNNGLTYLIGSNNDPSSGYLNIVIASVPEEDTYAMLLIGLGVMGVSFQRRSKMYS